MSNIQEAIQSKISARVVFLCNQKSISYIAGVKVKWYYLRLQNQALVFVLIIQAKV